MVQILSSGVATIIGTHPHRGPKFTVAFVNTALDLNAVMGMTQNVAHTIKLEKGIQTRLYMGGPYAT